MRSSFEISPTQKSVGNVERRDIFVLSVSGIREIRLNCSRREKETMESEAPNCMQSRTFIINRINSNSGNFCYNEELNGG